MRKVITILIMVFLSSSIAQTLEFTYEKKDLPNELFYTNKFSENYFCKKCRGWGVLECFMEQEKINVGLAETWFRTNCPSKYVIISLDIKPNKKEIVACGRDGRIMSYFSSCKREIISSVSFKMSYRLL